jgi:hypothetical protein
LRLVHCIPFTCPRYDPSLEHREQFRAHHARKSAVIPERVSPEDLDVYDERHQAYLRSIGIFVEIQPQGVRLLQIEDPNSPQYNEGVLSAL